MTVFFEIYYFLYFLKLSAGRGIKYITPSVFVILLIYYCFYKTWEKILACYKELTKNEEDTVFYSTAQFLLYGPRYVRSGSVVHQNK